MCNDTRGPRRHTTDALVEWRGCHPPVPLPLSAAGGLPLPTRDSVVSGGPQANSPPPTYVALAADILPLQRVAALRGMSLFDQGMGTPARPRSRSGSRSNPAPKGAKMEGFLQKYTEKTGRWAGRQFSLLPKEVRSLRRGWCVGGGGKWCHLLRLQATP